MCVGKEMRNIVFHDPNHCSSGRSAKRRNHRKNELLGLDAPEVLSLSGLTGAQKKTLIKLRNELLSPSQKGNDLSPQQMEILHDIIKAFG